MKKTIKLFSLMVAVVFIGCGTQDNKTIEEDKTSTFVYGTTAYNVSNADTGLNPHKDYSGWSNIRYGVGETLFKYSQTMQLVPWLASSYERIDDNTWKVQIKDGITFSSGRKLDAKAVKECLENLIKVHDRAPYDLKISSIEASGQTVIFKTKEPVATFINYLSDPYGAIIDMQYGVTKDENVAGTGPFIATFVSDTQIDLVKNKNYWNGEVKTDNVIIKSITDGDTLTLALQSGELDAVQGLPYANLALFKNNKNYKISSADTTRAFFAQVNRKNIALQDINVRKAISLSIDRNSFTKVLLNGNGVSAQFPFTKSMLDENSQTELEFNIEEAKKLLAQSGYVDTNKDGYVDKDGKNLTLTWLTYPSRQELPLLAQMAQSNLKDIGIKIIINSTASHIDFIKSGNWDIYASAFVTAPTGDMQYFFTTHALKDSAKNRGGFYNEELENLNKQMNKSFDTKKRKEIGNKMAQILVNEYEFIFASHLKMSFVMKDSVNDFIAHPSDYYEITSELSVK